MCHGGGMDNGMTKLRGPTTSVPSRQTTTLAIAAVVSVASVTIFVTKQPTMAIVVATGVLLIGIVSINPMVPIAAAVPASLVVARLGGSTSNLSVSDFVLFMATAAAIPYVRLREMPILRRLLVVDLVYEGVLTLTVAYNPYRADLLEWMHELLIVTGSLIVGSVLGRAGYARRVLDAYLLVASVIAAFACIASVRTHFRPVYLPLGMQKNYIGEMMMFAVLIAFTNPTWLRLRTRIRRYILSLCTFGMLASQSKQAILAAFVAIVIIVLRTQQLRRKSKLALACLLPVAIFAFEGVTRELGSGNKFNSVHQRLTWYTESLQVFHASPWLGVGLRWWYTDRFPFSFQPPNAELEMVTSAGLIGLIAFIYLIARQLSLVWRIPSAFGTLPFALLFARIFDTQFDIFWVGGTTTLPFLVIGLGIGTWKRSETPIPGSTPRSLALTRSTSSYGQSAWKGTHEARSGSSGSDDDSRNRSWPGPLTST
jgi:polysaccharide biosynthesis protein PslJ